MTDITTIAAKLAQALKHHTCGRTVYGQWPAFKPGGRFKEVGCRACEALAEYEEWLEGQVEREMGSG